MDNETPRIRSLMRQATRNVDAGKFAAAEEVYQQILLEAPDNETAWLGLAQITNDRDTKEKAYEQVLNSDPENEQAIDGLRILRGEPLDANSLLVEENEPVADGSEISGKTRDLRLNNERAGIVGAEVISQVPPIEGHDHELQGEYGHPVQKDLDLELFCYRHPNRSTSLRCYKCNKPICSECTVKTPVGYLCPTCHREAEDAFFNSKPTDYLLTVLVALPLSLIAGYLVTFFSARGGFFIILIFIFAGGAVGGFIARLAKRAIGKRRGRFIPHVIAACIIIGVLFFALPLLLALFSGNIVLIPLIAIGVYLFTAASSAFYWAR